ncbi:MAG: HAD-IC family P-type ATPase, partial [Thermoproteota archaeon]
EDVLKTAGSLERFSEHPLAEAIVKASTPPFKEPENLEILPGMGVKALLENRVVLVGNRLLMESHGVKVDDDVLRGLQEEGKTVVIVASDNKVAGLIGLMDTPKEDAAEAVRRLREMGLRVVMLTGDNRRTAEAIAKMLGMNEVIPEVLPQDKARIIQELRKQGRTVAMVGDGVNDAPALAAADIGIAIGSGTDIAKETGGIILVKDRLLDVVNAIELGRKTVSKIRQNLFWAFIYNVILIPVAAGILYPFLLNPVIAAAAMALSSVSVTVNSIMLGRWRPRLE